ncbi:bifunctional 2',3'-cyclic-nucleotide 2'-phosphodiesterase/3'-nucleotidase [uncultured Shewanella sp.]|uniref:bifunctional 2',3'-cyclic-nucleotide 2'-phosphodiesterase/3'-nucleotidase n=1 Tax=uncultured Shewanella sp. TaxID=173975 RepID=UPI002603BB83|nr:bifunctional 2',3'-cyclic-nucleotide 2'-phosphodiesterase/3'-nucleotidase [uncultured Shewanella sp.]
MNQHHIGLIIIILCSLFACSSDDLIQEQIDEQAAIVKSQQTHVKLRLLETSDLQANMKDFNYYTGQDDPRFGLARTASLINKARQENPNSILINNGNLLQGSPLGDYANTLGPKQKQPHPVFLAMNLLNYTVGNIGHQDLIQGMPFLEWAINSANFPFINANIYCNVSQCDNGRLQGENLFTPYIIQPTTLKDNQGNEHSINIGYIGFVDPKVRTWAVDHLIDKITIKNIADTAEKFVPEMLNKGADLIIAIPHSGIAFKHGQLVFNADNAPVHLADIDGIDAILFGHSHHPFPSKQYANLWNSNIEKGTINGIAVVAPSFWGNHLGIIDLTLNRIEGKWSVIDSHSQTQPIFNQRPLVLPDKKIEDALEKVHKAILYHSDHNLGITDKPLYSALTLIQDSAVIQLLSDLQLHATKSIIQAEPAFKDIPILSAVSPARVGGNHTPEEADRFVDINIGEISYQDIIALYPYSSTLAAVKVTGRLIKEWLECSANQFNQISLHDKSPQNLINWSHPSEQFDIIKNIQYQIDVTKPSGYNEHCIPINSTKPNRISALSYTKENGNTLFEDDFYNSEFIVITNNHRAFSGQFPGTGPKYIIVSFPDDIQALLASYIIEQTQDKGKISVSPTHNWHLLPIKTKTQLDIRFQTQNTSAAQDFIKNHQTVKMIQKQVDKQGYANYQLLLNQADQ